MLVMASHGAATPPDACPSIAGLDRVLRGGTVLLLGEMHGTAESPQFASQVACAALAAGVTVTVALEIPVEEEGRVSAFLVSGGAESDRIMLLNSPFWNAEYQDGRRSRAMLDLLDGLRTSRTAAPHARVALIDHQSFEDAQSRDRAMAARIAEIHATAPLTFSFADLSQVPSPLIHGASVNAPPPLN